MEVRFPRLPSSWFEQDGPAERPGSVLRPVFFPEVLSKDGAHRYGDTDEASRTATNMQFFSKEPRRLGHQCTRLRLTCAVVRTLELSPSAATSLLNVSPSLPVAVTGPATAARAWSSNSSPFHPKSFSFTCFGQSPLSFLVNHFFDVRNVTKSPCLQPKRPADSHTRPGGFLPVPPQPILPAVTLSSLAPGEGWARPGP